MGENWKESLDLPAKVAVKTANGVIGSVDVIWDYTPLNLNKTGKYTLVGTLDTSNYPNPEGLYVTQIIYVREAKNLIPNGGFESGNANWGWGSSFESNVTPAAEGKVAFAIRSSSTAYASYHMLYSASSTSATLGAKVVEEGGGQYYMSAKVRDYLHSGETNHTDPLTVELQLRYKKDASASSSSLKGATDKVTLTEKYQEVGGVFNLDGDEVWIRTDLYLKSKTKFESQWILVDDVQLIPLNVTVTTYEGAVEEVQTIIPDRNIIQNYPDYIDGYTTADLMFPETVEVRSTKGEIVKVAVKWDYESLNLSKLGTYVIVGVLDDMKLANPDALTVTQTVRIVSYQNLLTRGDFEDGTSGWNHSNQLSAINSASPKLEGDYSLEVTIGRLDNYSSDMEKESWIQAFYSSSMATMGQRITKTGAGRYYFAACAQGSENATDVAFHVRFLYKNVAKGDTTTSTSTTQQHLSATEFLQSGGLVTVPGDVVWTRMDIYFNGTCNEMRNSILYLDQAEIVPLNVEAPDMNDIIFVEDPADIYVHQGTSVKGLKLPEKLEVLLKNAQRFDLEVKWDTSAFDPNKIGEQTITGTLVLGDKYKNTQGFVPSLKVTIRAKGEDLRQTIYISTSGSEDNDGLSPETPKQDIKNIPTYLKKGYNVRLKRGDIWYLPSSGISLKNIYGTEDAPIVLGAYGDSGELPIIAYMLKIEDSDWELVDAKRNVYATNVSSLGQRNGEYVHRCFVNDEAYTHIKRTNYVALDPGWYCSYGGKLYIRMPEGEAPKNVEVTPYGSGGNRLSITEVSHLTIEYIHFKGSSAINTMMSFAAPTEYLKFQYCSITHCYYYIMVFEASDERDHYKPEVSNCYIDAMFNEEEGAKNYDKHWNVGITEGIVMRDGVDGGWIHHNHIRNMSHAFISIESLDRAGESRTRGVRNTYIEDNLLEGGNALYARAFNINGGYNLSGLQMCHDNTWRRNRCYDMTTSSHLFGENNLVYSNIFSYAHCTYEEDGSLFDGKSAQPYGFDVLTYSDHGCVGNVLVNNTFYDVSSAVAIYDMGGAVYNSIFANNLIVNWTSDAGAVFGSAGAIFDTTSGQIYVMNNGVYAAGRGDHFVVDGMIYTAEAANNSLVGYSGNIYADPKFVSADLTLSGKEVRQDFTLSGESPMRYAGLSLYDSVYEGYSAWERLKAEYTDLNGVVYLAESPSIGAISYAERIGGEVASVGKLEDILARPGAELSQLNLPRTVTAVNDQGIDVILLIDWNEEEFDSSKAGTVTLNGQLRNGPHTELNVEGKTVAINIHLKDRMELVSVTTQLKPVTVFYNSSFESVTAQLPQSLQVVIETGFEEELPVSWICDTYKPTTPDTYTFKCVLPENLISNTKDFKLSVDVTVMHEIARGMELLSNPNFIDGPTSAPWKYGWGNGSFNVTQDPAYLMEGVPAAAIVTISKGKYGSLQQDVTGPVKLMGDGKYLFRCYMRSYNPGVTIDSSYADLQVVGKTTDNYKCRTKVNIGEEWVEFIAVMDIDKVDEAATIMFHTSTGKSSDDSEKQKSFVIAGCSFIFLGTTDAEADATMDSIGLDWNAIKGENGYDMDNVTSDLTLPTTFGAASTVKWSSSDESAITTDGKITMGRLPKTVTLTAEITYGKVVTTKKFTVTVPRDPSLPVFTGSMSASQQTVKPGEEFQVVISLKAQNVDFFNAYRYTLSFSTSTLEYVGISDASATVAVDGGKLVISGIGTERPITDTVTVTFRAKKSGVTDVKLVKVEVDSDPTATLETLPTMQITNGTVTIDVEKVETKKDEASKEENANPVIWIVIGIVIAVAVAGGAVALILIKKKKQNA